MNERVAIVGLVEERVRIDALTATSGVVLAAGFSLRAEGFKMTFPLGGSTVIERCMDGMMAVCDEIIVVGGYRSGTLQYLPGRYTSVRLVINEDFPKGMFSSVRRGLEEATGGQVFITPGDCPLIPRSVYAKMLGVSGDLVIPLYNGVTGHPVLLRSPAVRSLMTGGHDTLRDFIHSFGHVDVAVDEPGILEDLDTQEDYRAMLAVMEGTHGSYRDGTREQREDNTPV